ncbi:hypothetical protein [Mitsuokella sp.]|uniref:hypothetical protein n=1 Tax=Mitsuokella sp. TaxID=2049034 RepID=UPI003D7D60F6
MSAFLAPIHFMVYGKNQLQEQLIAAIADKAVAEGWQTEAAVEGYVHRETQPLENIIDLANIHGWLSASIEDVEHRLAALVTELLFGHPERQEVLERLAYEEGTKQAAGEGLEAGEVFQYMMTHLVDGMPCDGVNMMRDQSADTFRWDKMADVHSRYWTEVEGSPAVYDALRSQFVAGMLEKTGYEVFSSNGVNYVLQKKQTA